MVVFIHRLSWVLITGMETRGVAVSKEVSTSHLLLVDVDLFSLFQFLHC